MKPPISSKQDQDALWEGLRDGTIDIVETDHAPHTKEKKEKDPPAFGVPGLETNEGMTALLCYDADKVRIIAEAIKNEVGGGLPLVLKISYFTNDNTLENFIQKVGSIIDGITAINTISAEVIDRNGKQALPGEGRLRSGICGSSIKWAGVDMIRRLKQLRERYNFKFAIIGVGGIMNPADFKEYINAGADAAMSATGAMWNPYLAKEINSARSDFQQLKQNYNSYGKH